MVDSSEPSRPASLARDAAGVLAVVLALALLWRVAPTGAMAAPGETPEAMAADAANLFDQCLNPDRVVRYNKPR